MRPCTTREALRSNREPLGTGFARHLAALRRSAGAKAKPTAILSGPARGRGAEREPSQKVDSKATEAFVHQALPYQMLTLDAIQANGRRADDVAFQMMAEPIPRP
jgi:hypothetical protein